MSVTADVLRSTPVYVQNYADRYTDLTIYCKAFDIDSVLKVVFWTA